MNEKEVHLFVGEWIWNCPECTATNSEISELEKKLIRCRGCKTIFVWKTEIQLLEQSHAEDLAGIDI